MAPAARAEVSFVSLKSCLVNLPPNLIALLSNANTPAQNVIIELQYQSQTLSAGAVSSGKGAGFMRSAYMGWTGMPSRTRPASLANVDRHRSGSRDLDVQTVEIDGTFARLLGVQEGQKVGLLIHLDPPLAYTVNVEPRTPADWEVIELHATFLELNLLSQIRALPNPGFTTKSVTSAEHNHPLTLHLSPTSTANIIVTSVIPPQANTAPFVKVAPDAEVIVAPKDRTHAGRQARTDSRSIASRRSGKSGRSNGQSSGGRRPSNYRNAVFLRAIDRDIARGFFQTLDGEKTDQALKVWVSKQLLSSAPFEGMTWASITLVKPAGLRAQLDDTQMQKLKEEEASDVGRPASRIVAEIVAWEHPVDQHHVGLSSPLSDLLGVKGIMGNFVRLEPAYRPLHHSSIQSLQLFPFVVDAAQKKTGLQFGGDSRAARQATGDRLRLAHDGEDGLLSGPLTDGMVLPPSADPSSASFFPGGILRFQQKGQSENADSLIWAIGREQKHAIEVRSEVPRPVQITTLFPTFVSNMSDTTPDLIGADALLKQCMSNLTLCSSVLLTGGTGAGKTSYVQYLAHSLRQDYLFNVTYFSCQTLVTDEIRVSTIKDTLTRLFMSASWCARLGGQAVVILDDLDKVCPVETELQVGNDNGRSRQITEVLCSVVREYCSIHTGVALLATAQSKDSLHEVLIGGHVLGDIISIKTPTKDVRRNILHKLVYESPKSLAGINGFVSHSRQSSDPTELSEDSWMDPSTSVSRPTSSSSQVEGFRVSHTLDLLDIAGQTDGYMPADLVLLVSRARSQALTRFVTDTEAGDTNLTLSKADFESALRNFTPSSLRNITLMHSTTTFAAIGGLHATRKILLETLLYPTKYAPVFAKSPLRLRSGLLLYGYPGCGKTLLASAVAGECNLNFISVKGPEILNKYIGASEKSVRDLFERAQAAKPCVLFFDEFDSIAPKRGHDSTGVTDRVVNQMLTQMDGAEGLEGVYVLAATSRPDLIDPALLRPGRLDKSLLCDMPDMDERHDILQTVSEKLVLRADVTNRLLTVAERAKGFTGADLQALMYNAHLEAIHDLLGDKFNSKPKHDGMNGTNQPRKGSAPKARQANKKHDFTQFLYGTEEDDKAKVTKSLKESKAAIAAKLDELKMLRKKERAVLRGDYAALHQQNDKAEAGDQDKKDEVVIEWKHIEKSLATTRSSISPEEHKRLEIIYREFVVGRKGDMPNGDGGREIGARSSLR